MPPRDPDRVVDAVLARGVGRRHAALRVGVRAGEAADRQHRQAVRDLDDVARRPHARRPACACGRRRSRPPVVPTSRPAACGQRRVAAPCAGTTITRRRRARRPRSRPRARGRRRRTPRAACRGAASRRAARATRAPARRRRGRAPRYSTHGPSSTKSTSARGGRGCRPSRRRAGVAPTTTTRFIASSCLSNSIAARMFLT